MKRVSEMTMSHLGAFGGVEPRSPVQQGIVQFSIFEAGRVVLRIRIQSCVQDSLSTGNVVFSQDIHHCLR